MDKNTFQNKSFIKNNLSYITIGVLALSFVVFALWTVVGSGEERDLSVANTESSQIAVEEDFDTPLIPYTDPPEVDVEDW